MTRARGAIGLAALVAALTVGCMYAVGERDARLRLNHDAYLAALHVIERSPAARDADRLFLRLATGAVSPEECRQGARRFADDVSNVVGAIDRLRPPPDAAGLQRKLVAAARRSEHALDDLADDVAAGRVRCGQSWNRRAYGLPSTLQAQHLLDEYARRGYRLDINGE
jgi:hypothetical protein